MEQGAASVTAVLGVVVGVLLLVLAYVLAGSDARARRAFAAGYGRGHQHGQFAAQDEAAA